MSDPSPNLPVAAGGLIHAGGSPLPDADRLALAKAYKALEHTNLATKLAGAVGRQLGTLGRFLPPGVSGVVNRAAESAIKSALNVALQSLSKTSGRDTRRLHKAMAVASGAAGGMFGMTTLPVELTVSTIIILRSIADIARSEGEDLSEPDVALSCLEVFAIGANSKDGGVLEDGYFATRGLLAKTVSEAGQFVAVHGLGDSTAPILVKLISQIGGRFGIVVSEKLAAQAVPLIGAVGGAAVNYAFADHFQSLAFGHFTVRRLERLYGSEVVRAEYDRLAEDAVAA